MQQEKRQGGGRLFTTSKVRFASSKCQPRKSHLYLWIMTSGGENTAWEAQIPVKAAVPLLPSTFWPCYLLALLPSGLATFWPCYLLALFFWPCYPSGLATFWPCSSGLVLLALRPSGLRPSGLATLLALKPSGLVILALRISGLTTFWPCVLAFKRNSPS